MFNSVHHPTRKRGILTHLSCTRAARLRFDELLTHGRLAARDFFSAVREKVPHGANRVRVTESGFAENLLDQPLKHSRPRSRNWPQMPTMRTSAEKSWD